MGGFGRRFNNKLVFDLDSGICTLVPDLRQQSKTSWHTDLDSDIWILALALRPISNHRPASPRPCLGYDDKRHRVSASHQSRNEETNGNRLARLINVHTTPQCGHAPCGHALTASIRGLWTFKERRNMWCAEHQQKHG